MVDVVSLDSILSTLHSFRWCSHLLVEGVLLSDFPLLNNDSDLWTGKTS